jgi:hypothetical protein
MGGNLHLCPDCVDTKVETLSSGRSQLRGWSYALGAVSTIALATVFSSGSEAGGTISFVASLVGTGLGFGATERRLHTPTSVWFAAIWNAALMGIFLLLMVIGVFVGTDG